MILKRILLPLILLTSFSFNGCARDVEEVKQEYDAKRIETIKVNNENGCIKIDGWQKNYLRILAKKETSNGKGELEKVSIQVKGDTNVAINTVYKEKDANVAVSYEIKVPQNIRINSLNTSNGDIDVLAASGDLSANTSNGSIKLEEIEGYVSAETSNGDIKILKTKGIQKAVTSNGKISAEMFDIKNKQVDIKTSNGEIVLYIGNNLDANIDMLTSNGKVNLNGIKLNQVAHIASESVKAELGKGGYKLNLQTSNGDINLYKIK